MKTSEERLLEALSRLLEYNPYHSKDTGQFTSEGSAGTTVAYGGKSGKAAKSAARKERFNRTVGRSSPRLNQELARRLHGEDGGELTASRAVGGITDDKPGRYARMQRAGERPPEFLRTAARNAAERAKAGTKTRPMFRDMDPDEEFVSRVSKQPKATRADEEFVAQVFKPRRRRGARQRPLNAKQSGWAGPSGG